jgi:hypothetical protein
MGMKLLYLLLALWILGCSHIREYGYTRVSGIPIREERVIYVDKGFGRGDRIEINRAIEQWNYVLNGFLYLRVESWEYEMEPVEGYLFLKIDHTVSFIPVASTGETLAFVDTIGGRLLYLVRDRLGNEDVYPIMLHEIGHLLGAKHGQKLMLPIYDRAEYQCIDGETVSAVAQHNGYDFSKMNHCL